MKKMGFVVVISVLMLMVAACGQEEYEPEAINEETDTCVVCNMAIEDGPFATQIITKDGQSLKFDDIGCMNEWKVENGTDTIGAAFVRDYHTLQWLPEEKAYYVYDASFRTPMAYGIVSFENEEDAKAYIEEQGSGELMTAEDLKEHTWERNREMMGHEHSHDGEMEGDMSHDEMMDHEGDMSHDAGGHSE